ncbi:alpha/beta hydrolase [Enemella sp. A6]|uniref:alpha/beta hydrolase n=1 Tax=Enemella sp. A6 TaxID=3440152 RepID=UPI003EBF9515
MVASTKRRIRAAAAAVLALGLVAGCTPEPTNDPGKGKDGPVSPDRPKDVEIPDVKPEGFVDAPGGGMEGYLGQKIDWQKCEDSRHQCATIAAPLDYDDPDRQALSLFLTKVPATEEPKLGTIFVNPGGPGAGGSELAIRFKREGLEQYDVIGWDPRGTGKSTPVECWQGEEMDKFTELGANPDDQEGYQELIEGSKGFGMSCLEKSGELLKYVSTQNTARDLDMMREMVGDEKLNYLGYSYGTELGATYAEMFPEKAGKLVLDSAVNITDNEEVVQAMGFDRAFTNFAKWCVEGDTCAELGKNPEEVIDNTKKVLDDLKANPQKGTDGRTITQAIGLTGIVATLYAQETWDYLQQALIRAKNGDPSLLQMLSDVYNQRNPNGTYESLMHAFPSIRCLDEPDEGLKAAEEEWRENSKKAPIFGPYFGADTVCTTWPVPAVEPLEKITAKGADPILVVGITGDPATPYEFAEWMAEQLDSGSLLTLEGEGHGAYGSNDCIDEAVVKFFVDGTVPEQGKTCKA